MELFIEGSPYFRTEYDRLLRAIRVSLPETFSGSVKCLISGDIDPVTVYAQFEEGKALAYCVPETGKAVTIQASIEWAGGTQTGSAVIPPLRPWTIYIAQDKHLDFGWIHPVEKVIERINVLSDYAMDHLPRWNFESSIWIEEYLRGRPSKRGEELLSRLKSGAFETAAQWLVPSPGTMSAEEFVQMLMYARTLQEKGIPVRTAMLEEAPSLAWGMATILAGAGIPYVIKGAYNLRNPHLNEKEPFPLSYWEGPDGSRVLLRWDCYEDTGKWGGYSEGYVFWRGKSLAERVAYIEKTTARYEAYQHYPYRAILLAGTGFDEYPQTTAVTDFIHWFNAQGWEYPRLVDATWNDYWQAIESQIDPAQVPVQRGDWGTAWEEWPAQLARVNNVYRRARELLFSAQTLTALTARLDAPSHALRLTTLKAAWRALLQYDEHDYGGISADIAEDTCETKASFAHAAQREAACALESSVSTLASLVPAQPGDGRSLLVVNTNSWKRGGVVEVVAPEAIPYEVIDLDKGQPIPSQLETRGPGWQQHYLSFMAEDVPAFGYRTYLVRQGVIDNRLPPAVNAGVFYENAFYRLMVNTNHGGLDALLDKETGRELVSTKEGFALNEYLHVSQGTLHRAQLVSIHTRPGLIATDIIIKTTCLRAELQTTYRLYHHTRRLDFINELHKEASSEPQANWFAFPLNISNHQYYYDGAAAILRPGLAEQGGDLLRGAGLSSTAVQSFLAAADQAGTILLATPDAYLFQFGQQVLQDPLVDSDPQQPLALSLAMHNFTRNDFNVRQGGQEYFTFRYSLSSASGPFDPSQAVRFAREFAQDLPRAWVTGQNDAALPLTGSFGNVTPDNVITTGFKAAEDGQGWVLRLWECSGKTTDAVIDVSGLNAVQAWECDLLEGKKAPLEMVEHIARLRIPANGLKATRFI